MTAALKFKPPEIPKPYAPLRSAEAVAFWNEMHGYYGDWTPDTLRTLTHMANDLGIIAECDAAIVSDEDSPALELTRLDLRRDRAIKRFERGRLVLNLDIPPKDIRPPRSETRYGANR